MSYCELRPRRSSSPRTTILLFELMAFGLMFAIFRLWMLYVLVAFRRFLFDPSPTWKSSSREPRFMFSRIDGSCPIGVVTVVEWKLSPLADDFNLSIL